MNTRDPDKGSSDLETCPMCGSPFDLRVHELRKCSGCGAEGSTACCLDTGTCEECDR